MRIAVLGTGPVGRTLAHALAQLGHEVRLGTRDPAETAARDDWTLDLPLVAFADVAGTAGAAVDLVVNATNGAMSREVVAAVGGETALAGRILLDVSNPLDFSQGFPPSLFVKDTDSLAEQIQRDLPATRVVKSLNTVNHELMVDPARVAESTMFLAGDDVEARAVVRGLLHDLGWRDVIEFPSLSAARGMEMWLPLWVRLMQELGTPDFNIRVVREPRRSSRPVA